MFGIKTIRVPPGWGRAAFGVLQPAARKFQSLPVFSPKLRGIRSTTPKRNSVMRIRNLLLAVTTLMVTTVPVSGEDRVVIVLTSNVDTITVQVGQVIRVAAAERPGSPVSLSVEGNGKLISTSTILKTIKGIPVIENEASKEFEVLATNKGKIRISVNTANATKSRDGEILGLSAPYLIEVVDALPKKK
jgi:hypothetical protein